MHNGVFKSLEEVVRFYNTRDALPRCETGAPRTDWGERCWPAPEVEANVNRTELGDLGLTRAEEARKATEARKLEEARKAAEDAGFQIKDARSETAGEYRFILEAADAAKLNDIQNAVKTKVDVTDWSAAVSGNTVSWTLSQTAQRVLAEQATEQASVSSVQDPAQDEASRRKLREVCAAELAQPVVRRRAVGDSCAITNRCSDQWRPCRGRSPPPARPQSDHHRSPATGPTAERPPAPAIAETRWRSSHTPHTAAPSRR